MSRRRDMLNGAHRKGPGAGGRLRGLSASVGCRALCVLILTSANFLKPHMVTSYIARSKRRRVIARPTPLCGSARPAVRGAAPTPRPRRSPRGARARARPRPSSRTSETRARRRRPRRAAPRPARGRRGAEKRARGGSDAAARGEVVRVQEVGLAERDDGVRPRGDQREPARVRGAEAPRRVDLREETMISAASDRCLLNARTDGHVSMPLGRPTTSTAAASVARVLQYAAASASQSRRWRSVATDGP